MDKMGLEDGKIPNSALSSASEVFMKVLLLPSYNWYYYFIANTFLHYFCLIQQSIPRLKIFLGSAIPPFYRSTVSYFFSIYIGYL